MNRQSLSPLMSELSDYIARAPRNALPPAVVEKTKHHILSRSLRWFPALACCRAERRFRS